MTTSLKDIRSKLKELEKQKMELEQELAYHYIANQLIESGELKTLEIELYQTKFATAVSFKDQYMVRVRINNVDHDFTLDKSPLLRNAESNSLYQQFAEQITKIFIENLTFKEI